MVLFFYIVVNVGARVVRKRLADRRVALHLQSAVAVTDAAAGGGGDGEEADGDGGAGGDGGGGKVAGASADLVFGPDGLLRSRGLAGGDGDFAALGLVDKEGRAEEKGDAAGAAGDAGTGTGDVTDPVAGLVGRISRIHRLQLEQMTSLTEQVQGPRRNGPGGNECGSRSFGARAADAAARRGRVGDVGSTGCRGFVLKVRVCVGRARGLTCEYGRLGRCGLGRRR